VGRGLPLSGQPGPGDLLPPCLPPAARRPLILLLQVALLVAVVAGSVAFLRQGKPAHITLRIDGQERQVRTGASSVGGVLAGAGVPVSSHDDITPDLGAKIADHGTIVIRRGRLLTLTLDHDATRRVWVTATSVSEALDQLGLIRPGEYVSASRSRQIGLDGAVLTVRLPQRVRLVADGKVRTVLSTRATVAEVLRDSKVTIGPKDLLSTPADSYPAEGLVERVTRVSDASVTASQIMPRSTSQVADGSLYVGSTRVVDDGQDGVLQLVFAIHTTNGKEASRTLTSQIETTPMRPRIIGVGTMPVPPPPAPALPPAPADVAYPNSGQGLNFAALANCESSGDPRAVSPSGTYRGLYQFSAATWHGVGGAGDPIDASASEQTYRAQILYGRTGRSSWPVCGQYL